jgi:hypothetical protein
MCWSLREKQQSVPFNVSRKEGDKELESEYFLGANGPFAKKFNKNVPTVAYQTMILARI